MNWDLISSNASEVSCIVMVCSELCIFRRKGAYQYIKILVVCLCVCDGCGRGRNKFEGRVQNHHVRFSFHRNGHINLS